MSTLAKDWNQYVTHAEEIARGRGFRDLRDRIVARAAPASTDVVVDVGAGTGLLTLEIAPSAERVWAIDISSSMCGYLRTKAASAGLDNVDVSVASAVSLPLVDCSADIVVSNYCFHHLDERGKRRALGEACRVLRPGGRLVFGDMMFGIGMADPRDRAVVTDKVRTMLRRGPAGILRLARNGARLASGRWEHPARPEWWRDELQASGFTEVEVCVLDHEGGIAQARCPPRY